MDQGFKMLEIPGQLRFHRKKLFDNKILGGGDCSSGKVLALEPKDRSSTTRIHIKKKKSPERGAHICRHL